MAEDIRIALGFWTHHKTVKLKRRAGLEGIESLLKLWGWTAQNRPQGRLEGMDIEDIEIASDWQGDPGKFVEILRDLRWLDVEGETYIVHDWEDHQPWVVCSGSRKEKASVAAKARWSKAKEEQQAYPEHTQAMPGACSEHATSMPDAMPSSLPFLKERKEKERTPKPPCRGLEGENTEIASDSLPDDQPQQPKPDTQPVTATASPKKSKAKPAVAYSEGFELFWQAYPRKTGKDYAFACWKKAKERHPDITPGMLVRAVQAQIEAGNFLGNDGSDFTPHPSTWLNQGRWQDEPKARSAPPDGYRRDGPPEARGIPEGYRFDDPFADWAKPRAT